ncbi:hypothetical protein LMG27952_04797 [Paraburkholderia hiiakae]|uniref:Uncharacterized protein n=1 Tax=Paraburkholderia hiiakae TaxID=1081782 RepID=A0ABM8NY25_9BURK|nr:hypothetical protein LMG27952_04797 [Paraburkholderia hiiakae]
MMNPRTQGCAERAHFSEPRELQSAENSGWSRETLDEKKPAAVSGLNPYQEETWRRQERLYRVG